MPGPARALFCSAGLACILALPGCRGDRPIVWDTEGAPRRIEQAEAGFRRFGEGRFEVVSFRAGAESTKVLEDDYHARSLLYRVPFHAHVRFVRDLQVEELERVATHIGEPGWTPDRHRDAVMVTVALGPGDRRAGAEEDVDALAVFEDLEPGWRFRAFDRER